MDPRRPRASVLSLFDPLSGTPNSFIGKENNAADSSFFHPQGLGNGCTTAQPTFRRRLVDVGDITIDEPDIQDLLSEEQDLEYELNCSLEAEDNDNDTLTFRDMVKAATPKWTGRHHTSSTTPTSTRIPRTPLAEISFKEQTTPMARKKSYKRLIMAVTSNKDPVDVADTPTEGLHPLPLPLGGTSGTSSRPLPVPTIELSLHNSQQSDALEHSTLATNTLSSSVSTLNIPTVTGPLITDISIPHGTPETSGLPKDPLGSSICTLNLAPPPTGGMIADTSMPLSVSPSSAQASPNTSTSSPMNSQARLRPDGYSSTNINRHSVDLQSSFQLHFTSSDATFDLLNEKISFFNSEGDNLLLNSIDLDGSFGEENFALAKRVNVEACVSEVTAAVSMTAEADPRSLKETVNGQSSSPFREVEVMLKPEGSSSCEHSFAKCTTPYSSNRNEFKGSGFRSSEINTVSPDLTKDQNSMSTPNTSSIVGLPPQVVPALKVVKRSRLFSNIRPNVSTPTVTHTTRASLAEAAPPPTSKNISSSPSARPTTSLSKCTQKNGLLNNGGLTRIVPIQPVQSLPAPTNGPRRVPISEGPKLNPGANVKAPASLRQTNSTSSGPRRIVVASASSAGKPLPVPVSKPAMQPHSGLKQPTKYITTGTTSAIPKPIARAAGSGLPGPPSKIRLTAKPR